MRRDVLAFLETARFVATELDAALVEADDDEVAVASVGNHYLSASGPAQCTALRLFTNNESVPDEGIFRAAELTFQDRYTVFFDPFWVDGLRLGVGDVADRWLAEARSARHERLFGILQETTWTNATTGRAG